MFHRHKWREIQRVYSPPRLEGVTSLEIPSREIFERIVHGFMTIELRCEECGDLKIVTTLGELKPTKE